MIIILDNDEIIPSTFNMLELKSIKVNDMDKVGDYLFIVLNNNQKILTNGKEIYDVSTYSHLVNMFSLSENLCAVFTKDYTMCVVQLKDMEVLLEDENAACISKQDDRTLHVIMKVGAGNNTIYDTETKKYLPVPDGYEFENSFGNDLYVFRDVCNLDTSFYDCKRCVIHASGKIIQKDIEGWIYYNNNHLIVIREDEIDIMHIDKESMLEIKNIKRNDKMLVKPSYYNGNIMMIEQNVVKVYTLDFELVNEYVIDDLKEVLDYEIVSDTLKLCLPYTMDGEQINKHLFLNLKTGKCISHIRIEAYPYWTPTTYVGQDSVGERIMDYHFYDADFLPLLTTTAVSYESIGNSSEYMFLIKTEEEEVQQNYLLNTKNRSIKKVDYNYVQFHASKPYGYGVNFDTETMDFFDEDLNILVSGFDYKKFGLDFGRHDFGYFIVGSYVCIIKHFMDWAGRSRYRTIIQNNNQEVILDSIEHECYEMGNFIQMIHNRESQFLNTTNGEIGYLGIALECDEFGKIDLESVDHINQLLTIENTNPKSKMKKIESKR